MTEIWEPVVDGTYELPGRGLVIFTRANRQMDREHPECIGETIRYLGELYTIVGVERHLPAMPIWKGEDIGLLIRAKPLE